MESSFVRWSGMALMVSGALLGLGMLVHPNEANPLAVLSAGWTPVHLVLLVAAGLSLVGLIGLQMRQAERSGPLGLAGSALMVAGTALLLPILEVEALVVPALAADATAQALLSDTGPLFGGGLGLAFVLTAAIFALGCLINAIAIVRAGALPRMAGVLLVGGALLAFNPPLPHLLGAIGGVLLGAGYAWLGYAIWAGAPARAFQRSAA